MRELAELLNAMREAGIVSNCFARQAAWQESRRRLPWPVKIRMAERLRDAVRQLRSGQRPDPPETPNEIGVRAGVTPEG